MLTVFDVIKQRYKNWKDSRFLKKHLCDNWEQYHRRYDPDISYRAGDTTNFYHGYAFVCCIDNFNHYAYELLYDYGPGGLRYGYSDILDWCKANCADKSRSDVHRTIYNQWTGRWDINEIGGDDRVFFAFKSSKDYVNFLLRWL